MIQFVYQEVAAKGYGEKQETKSIVVQMNTREIINAHGIPSFVLSHPVRRRSKFCVS